MNKRLFVIIPFAMMVVGVFVFAPFIAQAASPPSIVSFNTAATTCTMGAVSVGDYIVTIFVARVSGGTNGSFMQPWTVSDSLGNTFATTTGQVTSGAQFSSITTLSEVQESKATVGGPDTVTWAGYSNLFNSAAYCYDVTNAIYGLSELAGSYFNVISPTNSLAIAGPGGASAGTLFIGAGVGFQTGTNGLTGATFSTCTHSDCVTTTDSLTSGVLGALHGVIGSTTLSESYEWDFTYNSVFELAQSGVVFLGPSGSLSTTVTCTSASPGNANCTEIILTVYTFGTTTITSTIVSGTSTITLTITSTIVSTVSGGSSIVSDTFILLFIVAVLILVYMMRRVKQHQVLSGEAS